VLQPLYGGALARPFTTHHHALERTLYLRIATELYLKRMIVGGLEKVYELGKDFRNEGVSAKHNPEFTMVEFYEAYADYEDEAVRLEELVRAAAAAISYPGEIDFASRWRRVSFTGAIAQATEIDLSELRDAPALARAINERGLALGTEDASWAQMADDLLSKFVEPSLLEPTFVLDYPIELSPFARTTDDDPQIVERFEYYVGGMEIGNAFSELNDAEEQAARFALQATEGAGGNVEAEQGDPDYVEALSYGMPPTGGCGLGIDRLAMVLAGKDSIRDVILFPAQRAKQE
jgi:lysyl-tRNA synthetase, class II